MVHKPDRTQIEIAANWAAFSRAADKSETFEGIHGDHILVIVDEAKAVKAEIFDAIRRILRGNPDGKYWFVFLSSPGSPTGPFWELTSGDSSSRTQVFSLSAYESSRIDLDTIAQDAADLGEESPLFTAMVLGEFPTEGEDVVIPLSWAQAAIDREVDGGSYVLGVDVGRHGSDETALVSLCGRQARIESTYHGKDTVWTVGKIRELHERLHFVSIAIDDTGVGGGVVDQLLASEAFENCNIVPVNFGERQSLRHPDRYVNVKAEMYFKLREEFEAGMRDPHNKGVGLSIQSDKRLIHQLSCQHYLFDDRQRYRIERRESLRKRGERSPDRADALALANWASVPSVVFDEELFEINTTDAVHKGGAYEIAHMDF